MGDFIDDVSEYAEELISSTEGEPEKQTFIRELIDNMRAMSEEEDYYPGEYEYFCSCVGISYKQYFSKLLREYEKLSEDWEQYYDSKLECFCDAKYCLEQEFSQ